VIIVSPASVGVPLMASYVGRLEAFHVGDEGPMGLLFAKRRRPAARLEYPQDHPLGKALTRKGMGRESLQSLRKITTYVDSLSPDKTLAREDNQPCRP
jgi:hypothetical protein